MTEINPFEEKMDEADYKNKVDSINKNVIAAIYSIVKVDHCTVVKCCEPN